jgi:hypothetical protein
MGLCKLIHTHSHFDTCLDWPVMPLHKCNLEIHIAKLVALAAEEQA